VVAAIEADAAEVEVNPRMPGQFQRLRESRRGRCTALRDRRNAVNAVHTTCRGIEMMLRTMRRMIRATSMFSPSLESVSEPLALTQAP